MNSHKVIMSLGGTIVLLLLVIIGMLWSQQSVQSQKIALLEYYVGTIVKENAIEKDVDDSGVVVQNNGTGVSNTPALVKTSVYDDGNYTFSYPSDWTITPYTELYGAETANNPGVGSGIRISESPGDHLITMVTKPGVAQWLIDYRKDQQLYTKNDTVTRTTFNGFPALKNVSTSQNNECITTHIAVDIVPSAFEVLYPDCPTHKEGINEAIKAIVASIEFK